MNKLFLILIAIFLPPVAVVLKRGFGKDLLINILLCLLVFFPGMVHAWVRSQKGVILIQPQGLYLEPLATKWLKIQEVLSISPVRSISLLQSQASRRSPRIWLPTPLKTEKSTAF